MTVLNALQKYVADPLTVELVPNYPTTALISVNKKTYNEYYPHDKRMKVITSKETYFDGAIVIINIDIDINVPDLSVFIPIVSDYVDKMLVFEQVSV